MDIYKRIPGKDPRWIESAENVEAGFCRLIALCMAEPGEYFAYDTLESRIVADVSFYGGMRPAF